MIAACPASSCVYNINKYGKSSQEEEKIVVRLMEIRSNQ
jgi:hypothetical protein